MLNKAKNRGGRPARKAKPGERVQLSLRVTPELKARIDAAAADSGRSQSQEAEFRLDQSFHKSDLLSDVLELHYGRQLGGLLMLIGRTLHDAGMGAGFAANMTPEDATAWMQNPFAYRQAVDFLHSAVPASFAPPGDPAPPSVHAEATLAFYRSRGAHSIGVGVFYDLLAGLADGTDTSEWAQRVRALLGSEVISRIAGRLS